LLLLFVVFCLFLKEFPFFVLLSGQALGESSNKNVLLRSRSTVSSRGWYGSVVGPLHCSLVRMKKDNFFEKRSLLYSHHQRKEKDAY